MCLLTLTLGAAWSRRPARLAKGLIALGSIRTISERARGSYVMETPLRTGTTVVIVHSVVQRLAKVGLERQLLAAVVSNYHSRP